jgi:hypothetical protein
VRTELALPASELCVGDLDLAAHLAIAASEGIAVNADPALDVGEDRLLRELCTRLARYLTERGGSARLSITSAHTRCATTWKSYPGDPVTIRGPKDQEHISLSCKSAGSARVAMVTSLSFSKGSGEIGPGE